MQKQLYFDMERTTGRPYSRANGDLHAEPEGRALPERQHHPGGPRAGAFTAKCSNSANFGESKNQEGRAAHGGTRSFTPRRPAVRQAAGIPPRRRQAGVFSGAGRRSALIARPLGTRQTTTTFHPPERVVADPDDFVAILPGGRQGVRHRGRRSPRTRAQREEEPRDTCAAVIKPRPTSRNVSQKERRRASTSFFFRQALTQRTFAATFSFSAIEGANSARRSRLPFL